MAQTSFGLADVVEPVSSSDGNEQRQAVTPSIDETTGRFRPFSSLELVNNVRGGALASQKSSGKKLTN